MVIMEINGNRRMILFNKNCFGNHMSLGVSVPNGHILRAQLIDYIISRVNACVPSEYKKNRVKIKRLQSNRENNFNYRQVKMVGE